MQHVKDDEGGGMPPGEQRCRARLGCRKPSAETVEVGTSVGAEADELAVEEHLTPVERNGDRGKLGAQPLRCKRPRVA
jgi:hypothetical protein